MLSFLNLSSSRKQLRKYSLLFLLSNNTKNRENPVLFIFDLRSQSSQQNDSLSSFADFIFCDLLSMQVYILHLTVIFYMYEWILYFIYCDEDLNFELDIFFCSHGQLLLFPGD